MVTLFSLQSVNHNRPKYFGSRIVEANIANDISLLMPRQDRTRKIFVCVVLFTFFLFKPYSFQKTASL